MATLLGRTPATAAFAEAVLTLHRADGDDVALNLDERPPMSLVRAAPTRPGATTDAGLRYRR